MEKSRIGFIGLGIMGLPMAKNLLKNKYEVLAYDINHNAVEHLVAHGGVASKSVAEVASSCSTIITMLPNSPQVEEVVTRVGGIYDSALEGTLFIDMSSISPDVSRRLSIHLLKNGIRMLDAPVSGGEPKAIDASLAIMVGGEEEDYEQALPLLNALKLISITRPRWKWKHMQAHKPGYCRY